MPRESVVLAVYPTDKTAERFARDRATIDRLTDELHAERAARLTAESEVRKWRSRCYPTGRDVEVAGVSLPMAIAWMDTNLVRVACTRRWRGGELALLPNGETYEAWAPERWPSGTEGEPSANSDGWPVSLMEPGYLKSPAWAVAEAIEWAADILLIDQWDVLAQMAADANKHRVQLTPQDVTDAGLTLAHAVSWMDAHLHRVTCTRRWSGRELVEIEDAAPYQVWIPHVWPEGMPHDPNAEADGFPVPGKMSGDSNLAAKWIAEAIRWADAMLGFGERDVLAQMAATEVSV